MGRAEGVIFALGTLGEAREATRLTQGADAITTTGEDLMRIGLMANIPDQTIIGRVEDIMQSNRQLDHAAQIQAEQLAATGRLEHELKKVTFPTPVDRLKEAGDAWAAYGENIAEGQRTAQDVVASWMKSPPHRANILDTGFTEIGVGWAVDAAGRNHFAQVFGRPMAPASSR